MSVIETTRFRLQDSVDQDEFLVADKRVQDEFSPFQPGFVRRTTTFNDEGEWLVIVQWQSDEDADRSLELMQATDVVGDFIRCIDPATLRTSRFKTLEWLGR